MKSKLVHKDIAKIYAITKEELLFELNDDNAQDLSSEAAARLGVANIARSRWRYERQSTRHRKAGVGLQKFLSTFGEFLESYAGIVEIVKGADQQYGGLAYGTLSILLSVAVRKQQKEDGLEDALEELRFAFPRLNTLHRLGPNVQMKELIAKVFAEVIVFARETTEYYHSKSRRFKDAVLPASRRSDTMSKIRKHLGQIREESEVLMLERIEGMSNTIEQLNRQVGSVHLAVRTNKSSADHAHLADLRRRIGVKDSSINRDTKTYKERLSDAFSSPSDKHGTPSEITWALFEEDNLFAQWLHSEQSCFILLGGINLDAFDCKTLNWVSFGSTLVVERLQKQDECVAYFYCQTDWTVHTQSRRSLQQVMASIVYQIACCHEDLLRSKTDSIEAAMRSKAWNETLNDDVVLECMAGLLLELLSAFGKDRPLTIVLDRLDQCRWNEGPGQEGFKLECALEWLLEVVKGADCLVKILVVVDSHPALKLRGPSEQYAKRAKGRLLFRPDWTHELEEERQYRLRSDRLSRKKSADV